MNKITKTFRIAVIPLITFFCATSYSQTGSSELIDAPGKGYREMSGEETSTMEIIQVAPEVDMRSRIETLEKENSQLKKELELIKLEYGKILKLLNSLSTQDRKETNTVEQGAAANP